MIENILSEKDFDAIRGHFMGGKKLKVEREYLPKGYTLTITVKEAHEVWNQKMLIRSESQVGCNYRSQYHANLESLKRFIAEDDDFLKKYKSKKGDVSNAVNCDT